MIRKKEGIVTLLRHLACVLHGSTQITKFYIYIKRYLSFFSFLNLLILIYSFPICGSLGRTTRDILDTGKVIAEVTNLQLSLFQ